MKLAIFLAMSTTVNIAEFKDRFSEFLALVEGGGEVISAGATCPSPASPPCARPLPGNPGTVSSAA